MIQTIITSLIISILIQAVFFLFAAFFKSDKVTDLSYGLGFIILSIYLLFTNKSAGIVSSTISILVILWGIRLVSYLFQRILSIGKDKRFDGIREHFWKFFQFWSLQAISVWIIMFPTIIILSKTSYLPVSSNYYIGILIWILGLTIETIADQQKFSFKKNLINKDKWIESGIWKYSRHPNYFGEMLCWWGIYIITFIHLKGFNHVALLGPVYISTLLLFVSGIPPLEKKYNEKYKNNSAYQSYKRRTSVLIPLPIKKD